MSAKKFALKEEEARGGICNTRFKPPLLPLTPYFFPEVNFVRKRKRFNFFLAAKRVIEGGKGGGEGERGAIFGVLLLLFLSCCFGCWRHKLSLSLPLLQEENVRLLLLKSEEEEVRPIRRLFHAGKTPSTVNSKHHRQTRIA